MLQGLTEKQFRGWEKYYDAEPWGEERADLREHVNRITWAGMLAGSNKEPPAPVWPYWRDSQTYDPKEIDEFTANFADAIEPKPGGGYQYKPEALERMKALGMTPDGNDNRQT
jgi:hypothetical protein